MELLLMRDQKGGLMGGIKFQLTAKAKLAPEESDAVKRYKLGSTLLYEKPATPPDRNSITSLLAHKLLVPRIDVNDLVNGTTIEAKDILEVMAAEEQIKTAAEMFHKMLTAAKTFGGETVHTFSAE